MSLVEEKVCIVTGGAAGVGAGIVKTLLWENARFVAFLDIAEREGSFLEAELFAKFGALRAKFIKCDISDEEQLGAAFRQVFDKYRRLDIVVNNAAVLSADDHAYKKIVDVNFSATVNSTLNALDIMGVDKGGKGGTVVNVSTLLALRPKPSLPVYSATKIAVLQFSNSIGAEFYYSKSQVRVLTVCLGPTDTAILQKPNISNLDKDFTQNQTTQAPVRQRVESAVNGIIEVINKGESSSTWMIANDKPAVNITQNILGGFQTMTDSLGLTLDK
ncbi:15-hydroxyprostaglandin dehydrogenase [NAD(+)]-like [Ostrinia nubilalis]|uniref:15-hydroxyprostaglandin dehydrogenase [NAD(+)]-like n=1 Tax=Ostrinia nubilalis TaxID=29057 RepID=UPI0030825D77